VYPREVEEVLLTHAGVAEVAIVGVPDPRWGESGVAVVVRREGHGVDAAILLSHLEGRCARYRWPSRFVFWEALPRSGYGKVAKKDIRRMLMERGEIETAVSA
jgi:acyl-CoA synthetase (AMP-forming)/AMP-acid ligase II